jgi:hydroxyacylglutathione hydrolase
MKKSSLKIIQIKLAKMATYCYLVGDVENAECALIDPAFETDRILQVARQEGYRVTHVINTHCHSDHSAGNAVVLQATNARLMIHRRDADALAGLMNRMFSRLLGGHGSPKPDRLLVDGDEIRIGQIPLQVIHTPGHTPGSISLYTPGHVFTGDTLFVGGIGRTDLPGGSMKVLLQSIREKIYVLPGETVVWPGHDYGASPQSTVMEEIRTNSFTR